LSERLNQNRRAPKKRKEFKMVDGQITNENGKPLLPLPEFSTVTRDKLTWAVKTNLDMASSLQKVLDVVKMYPELDADFARAFNLTPPPPNR
jgi:hypothetical protein